jgi:hypothetical protein
MKHDKYLCIDFSSMNQYMDAFTAAHFLPHTDMKLFPSAGAPPVGFVKPGASADTEQRL